MPLWFFARSSPPWWLYVRLPYALLPRDAEDVACARHGAARVPGAPRVMRHYGDAICWCDASLLIAPCAFCCLLWFLRYDAVMMRVMPRGERVMLQDFFYAYRLPAGVAAILIIFFADWFSLIYRRHCFRCPFLFIWCCSFLRHIISLHAFFFLIFILLRCYYLIDYFRRFRFFWWLFICRLLRRQIIDAMLADYLPRCRFSWLMIFTMPHALMPPERDTITLFT